MDFQTWQHADVISAISLCIAGLAFLVSLRAQHFTKVQTRLAKERARAEREAEYPAIEPTLVPYGWPNWYRLGLKVRNRTDVAIVCEEMRLLKPLNASMILVADTADGKRDLYRSYVIPDHPPPIERLGRKIALDLSIPAAGTRGLKGPTGGDIGAIDFRHVDLFVLISSTSASSARHDLELSISVRRSNERVSFAEIIVVAKIPPVSTSTET